MLSCYSQEDSGPDMQKAWKGCLLLFFFFSFGHWVTEATASTVNPGLPSSQVPWPRMGILCSWSMDLLGPCPEHTHPATALLVPLRQGWQELRDQQPGCQNSSTQAKLLCSSSMRLSVTRCQWITCVLLSLCMN